MYSKPFTRLLVATTLSLAAAGFAHAAEPQPVVRDTDKSAAAQFIDDASITANVKARQAEDKTVRITAIGVETHNGVVQLSGFTPSAKEKMRAEEIARNTQGVKDVRNDIIIQR